MVSGWPRVDGRCSVAVTAWRRGDGNLRSAGICCVAARREISREIRQIKP